MQYGHRMKLGHKMIDIDVDMDNSRVYNGHLITIYGPWTGNGYMGRSIRTLDRQICTIIHADIDTIWKNVNHRHGDIQTVDMCTEPVDMDSRMVDIDCRLENGRTIIYMDHKHVNNDTGPIDMDSRHVHRDHISVYVGPRHVYMDTIHATMDS